MSSVKGIIESYSNDASREKLVTLDVLLKAVDARGKQPIVFSKFSNKASLNGKHFCVDCGKRLKTHSAKRCASCNMRLVGKNHVITRKLKGKA
ncbi:MAG: hypothetical protein ABSA79_01080 [Candidatus Bathyarchaeia archaeon]